MSTRKSKQKHQIQKVEADQYAGWAVYKEDNKIVYAAKPMKYRMRDGLAKAQSEQLLMAKFSEPGDTDEAVSKSLEELYLINNYPLLANGIAEAEGFSLPLSIEDFWDLPEEFALELAEAIRRENPQYAIPFLELRKMIGNLSNPTAGTPSTDTPPSEASDSKTSKPTS